MKTFALIFRMDITTPGAQPAPEQMKAYMERWMEWINGIAARGQLAEGGNHLSPNGKVVQHGLKTTDAPYGRGTESVAGYILVNAKDMNEALGIAEKCPILQGNGNTVEIRETATPQNIDEIKRN